MKPEAFEFKVIKVIKTLREMKGLQQLPCAAALGMSECNYFKIERGESAISIELLKILSEFLGTSYHQILMLAEGPDLMNTKINPLSKILVEYFLLLESRAADTRFTKEELEELISKIKDFYNK
jgi:transcriptional regulator with XRE-family HTH domain